VEQVALGDQHQAAVPAEHVERLGHAVEQLDRVRQELLAEGEDALDPLPVDLVGAQGERRLDHGEGEALHPVAEQGEVAALRVEERRRDGLGVDPGVEDLHEALLRDVEVPFRMPEGVVPVHPDHVDGHGTSVIGAPTVPASPTVWA
jgi:hypothetical protein